MYLTFLCFFLCCDFFIFLFFFFFQAEDGIRDPLVTGVQTCALPISSPALTALRGGHIEGVLLALGTMTGQLRSGTVRGIVISSKYPDFPEIPTLAELRSEERRVGKECRSRGSLYEYKKEQRMTMVCG